MKNEREAVLSGLCLNKIKATYTGRSRAASDRS